MARVVLTQPRPRVSALALRLADAGHEVSTLGFAQIELRVTDPAVHQRLVRLADADWVVPVSPSAIDALAAWLSAYPMKLRARAALIGPGSLEHWTQAFELRHFEDGVGAPLLPRQGEFDAAALIAEPELQQLAGQRMVVIQSAPRPPPWVVALEQRGAEVVCVPAYRVLDIRPSPEETLQLLDSLAIARDGGHAPILSVSSVAIAQALVAWLERSLPAEWQPVLARCRWLANHRRVAESLQKAGFVDVDVVRPGESGLIEALESGP